jgi:hypothetical protein
VNRALVAVVVVAAAGPACKKPSKDRAALEKVVEFSNRMCQCKDKACADLVMRDMKRWGDEMAKNADPHDKPDPKQVEKVTQAMSDFSKCATNLLAGGSQTPPQSIKSTDADVLIVAALAEAKQAPLSELTVAYVKSDATLDATYGKLTVRSGKRPPQDPADDPKRPIGAPVPPVPPPTVDVDCWTFEVENGKQKRETFPCLRGELAQPHCTVREVWKRAMAAEAPPSALATVTLVAALENAPQHWLLAIEDAPRNLHFLHEVIDDCPPVLEKQ